MIYNDDCLVVMKELIENGTKVDSIVTDPPYHLTNANDENKGFMGKQWDGGDIAFSVETWKLAYNLLKPGGHLIAFSASRTYHHMVLAIENAGFEIRDQLMWIYGCLSEDTEILTSEGWQRYHKNINSNSVLCYDIENDEFIFDKPTESYYYENKHPAYHIKSDFTDQIVSRNHRCVVERNGRKSFQWSETLEQQEDIPFLESLYDLPETIYDVQSHTSITKQDLLKAVQKRNDRDEEHGFKITGSTQRENKYKLFGMRNFVLSKQKIDRTNKRTSMFTGMQWSKSWRRVEEACTQRASKLVNEIRTRFNRTNDGFNKPCMEGWSDLRPSPRQLHEERNFDEMSERIQRNETSERLCFEASVIDGTTHGQMFGKRRGSASHRSQSVEQQNRKSNAISKQQRTQTIRSTKATIEEIEYNGHVWCVTVSTGAFVARRNGKIFITGNSGFPKGHNISKGLEKSGATSEEIESWEGWNTVLKPAHEPIVLARKPVEPDTTIAQNVLKHGTGGLNVSECSVGDEKRYNPSASKNKIYGQFEGAEKDGRESTGRYPSNVIHDGSDEVSDAFKEYSLQGENPTRFFYGTKTSETERKHGIANIENSHPTVKPQDLMRYLCRLITPKNGTVFDPFMGSGSTGIAAKTEGFDFIGVEREQEYFEIAKTRMELPYVIHNKPKESHLNEKNTSDDIFT